MDVLTTNNTQTKTMLKNNRDKIKNNRLILRAPSMKHFHIKHKKKTKKRRNQSIYDLVEGLIIILSLNYVNT